ncbi:MAG: FAD-dependent oxidoreductase [Deltaproteobacteria bacterium]|nr:FAD-dependent oxidoreductase [Deltaproteobacteria bacterium]
MLTFIVGVGFAPILGSCGGGGGSPSTGGGGSPPGGGEESAGSPSISPDHVYLWEEAEHFQDFGGWLLETQFIGQMGSAYLMAEGLDGPAAPARTSVTVPRAGNYQVWARCKNWAPEWSPGRFQIEVAGALLPRELGTRPDGTWCWEEAGEVQLSAGTAELVLHDLTGHYGRLDALLLTTDPNFLPPDSASGTEWLRGELSGVDPTPADAGTYDLVVAGGGLAGTLAAVAAARNGLRVALLQTRPVLGGNAAEEVGVRPEGAGSSNVEARETGLVEEVSRIAYSAAPGGGRLGYDGALHVLCEGEPNLQVHLNTRVYDVELAEGRIAALIAADTVTGQRRRFWGALFADCTGDGVVGAAAGAAFFVGREGRDVYGEELAPDTGDAVTLGTSLLYGVAPEPTPQRFTPPIWARHFEPEDLYRRPIDDVGPFWWVEWGGHLDTIGDAEEIRDELLRISFGVWDLVKNRSAMAGEAANLRLVPGRVVAGKRESRRLVGEHVLTESEVREGGLFPDVVAHGGWPIDLHAPLGIDDPGAPNVSVPVDPYGIPLRSLYSRDVENLFMAGRNLSASHVGLGSSRVMLTCGALGQAVGTAAALCWQRNVWPRELARGHVAELQQLLLKDDAYVPGIVNQDPLDLARTSVVTASGTRDRDVYDINHIYYSGSSLSVNAYVAQAFIPSCDRLEKVALSLKTGGGVPVTLTARLRVGETADLSAGGEDLAVATALVLPNTVGWVEFPLRTPLRKGTVYWVRLDRVPPSVLQVEWRGAFAPCGGLGRVVWSVDLRTWTNVGTNLGLATTPPITAERPYDPANAVNGLARPSGPFERNLWVSAGRSFPHWLQFELPAPSVIHRVHIVFDTNLDQSSAFLPPARETVKDYEVQVRADGVWTPVASVTENIQRFRRHEFEPVRADAVRVVVNATHGHATARIYEVRIY